MIDIFIVLYFSGSCTDDRTHLLLPDGLETSDSDMYLKAWAVGECSWDGEQSDCEAGVTQSCELLASEVFSQCHALVPPLDYVAMCRQVACHPSVVCDLLTAYSSACKQQGVCVNWRTSDLCRKSFVRLYLQKY